MNEIQRAVLSALADSPEPLYEGEIKEALGRSWSLLPTLRALWRKDLVERAAYWAWTITDEGLLAIDRAPRKPVLTLLAGGASSEK